MSPPGSVPRLDPGAEARIERILDALESADAPTAVTERSRARDVHIADSLSGLAFTELRESERVCDVGSGAGFPGLVLAAALPETRFHLLDSVRRKCRFIEQTAADAGLRNVTVVAERAETWARGEGRERFDLITARAVGRLSTLAELASPLLRDRGALLAWKGRRDAEEESELERAAEQLAMRPLEVRWVGPYAGSENRHLHLIGKRGPTPQELPRRPGMAKKRPRGGG